MEKKLNVLYFSATDTTAKIVKEIARGMGKDFKEYDITPPDSREKDIAFGENDLVIVGVPVYSGRVPEFLVDYFKKVKGEEAQAVFVVVYGNRDYDDALLELKDIFEKSGFKGVAAGAFVGEHSYTSEVAKGRPDADDLKAASGFGVSVMEKLSANPDIKNMSELAVKGCVPYKERKPNMPMAPETGDACTDCGICAKHCPVGAISFDEFTDIDPQKCIKCCSCIKRCPVQAKEFNNEFIQNIVKKLTDNFSSTRCEPEIFI